MLNYKPVVGAASAKYGDANFSALTAYKKINNSNLVNYVVYQHMKKKNAVEYF